MMQVEKVRAEDVFKDTNNGYLYGLQEVISDGLGDYCEWFKTEKERDDTIKENNMIEV